MRLAVTLADRAATAFALQKLLSQLVLPCLEKSSTCVCACYLCVPGSQMGKLSLAFLYAKLRSLFPPHRTKRRGDTQHLILVSSTYPSSPHAPLAQSRSLALPSLSLSSLSAGVDACEHCQGLARNQPPPLVLAAWPSNAGRSR